MYEYTTLQQLHSYLCTLPRAAGEKRAEVVLYGSMPLPESMVDKVLQQIAHVAALLGLVGAAMTMPDAHWGLWVSHRRREGI